MVAKQSQRKQRLAGQLEQNVTNLNFSSVDKVQDMVDVRGAYSRGENNHGVGRRVTTKTNIIKGFIAAKNKLYKNRMTR